MYLCTAARSTSSDHQNQHSLCGAPFPHQGYAFPRDGPNTPIYPKENNFHKPTYMHDNGLHKSLNNRENSLYKQKHNPENGLLQLGVNGFHSSNASSIHSYQLTRTIGGAVGDGSASLHSYQSGLNPSPVNSHRSPSPASIHQSKSVHFIDASSITSQMEPSHRVMS